MWDRNFGNIEHSLPLDLTLFPDNRPGNLVFFPPLAAVYFGFSFEGNPGPLCTLCFLWFTLMFATQSPVMTHSPAARGLPQVLVSWNDTPSWLPLPERKHLVQEKSNKDTCLWETWSKLFLSFLAYLQVSGIKAGIKSAAMWSSSTSLH